MNEWLKFEKNGSIATLKLNRPDIRNPLGEPEDAENFEEARDLINNDREISIKRIPIPDPGVPSRIACGGYKVHPEPVGPPGTKKLAIKTATATKNIQKLNMFTYGKTISRAPTIKGIK